VKLKLKMSAYSTIFVTESKARDYLIREIISADYEKLKEYLDKSLRDRLYNVVIVDDGSKINDDELL
jgi:hypothetical protein